MIADPTIRLVLLLALIPLAAVALYAVIAQLGRLPGAFHRRPAKRNPR